MKIQIDDIPAIGLALDLGSTSQEVRAAAKALGLEAATAAIRFTARLVRTGDLIDVAGEISGQVHVACSRCLADVNLPIDDRFQFFLCSPATDAVSPGVTDIELTSEALDYGFLDGTGVDVDALLQEQIALALPAKPLCRADCRGICQGCGADLNHEPCRCTGATIDARWDPLRKLKLS